MTGETHIAAIDPWDTRLDELATEARSEGYNFVDRLLFEARSGVNRFDKNGEVFLGAFVTEKLVGCGGVNLDPYSNQEIGRIRHVFVLYEYRRKGVGTALVKCLLLSSKSRFDTIRLRTSDARGDLFYEAIGFSRTTEEAATHVTQI